MRKTLKTTSTVILKYLFQITQICCNFCAPSRTFILSSEIGLNMLPTHIQNLDATQLQAYIDAYLTNCSFVNMGQLNTFELCEKGCAVHQPCIAFKFQEDSGCEFCINELLWIRDSADGSRGSDWWIARGSFMDFVAGKNIMLTTTFSNHQCIVQLMFFFFCI